MGGDICAASIEAKHEAVAETVCHIGEPGKISNCFCADDNPLNTQIEKLHDRTFFAYAASDFDTQFSITCDGRDSFKIDGTACVGAVKVDKVEPLGAGIGK